MSRFTMRIEVWEKDPETGEVFGEYGELYFRDGNNYYVFSKDGEGLVLIPNPFKNRLDLKSFNKKNLQIKFRKWSIYSKWRCIK